MPAACRVALLFLGGFRPQRCFAVRGLLIGLLCGGGLGGFDSGIEFALMPGALGGEHTGFDFVLKRVGEGDFGFAFGHVITVSIKKHK